MTAKVLTPCVDDDQARPQTLLKRFWETSALFWRSERRFAAWMLTILLLLVVGMVVGAAYAMNVWNRAMFDALQNRNGSSVASLSLLYFAILLISVALGVLQVLVRMTLQRRWRSWLNDQLVDRWMASGRYYQLKLVRGDHANPEYRIADDVRIATEAPVDFVTGIAHAFLSAATFIIVLWTIGGALNVTIAGRQLEVPGFLVIAAVVYALVASGSMMLIGSRFVHASDQESSRSRVSLRHHALARERRKHRAHPRRGRGTGRGRPGASQGARCLAVHRRAKHEDDSRVVSQTSSFIAPVLPIILCAPKFLERSMTLGEVMQAASAFTIVQGAFNWLVDNYPQSFSSRHWVFA